MVAGGEVEVRLDQARGQDGEVPCGAQKTAAPGALQVQVKTVLGAPIERSAGRLQKRLPASRGGRFQMGCFGGGSRHGKT